LPLHEVVLTIFADIGDCGTIDSLVLLESVAPECRRY